MLLVLYSIDCFAIINAYTQTRLYSMKTLLIAALMLLVLSYTLDYALDKAFVQHEAAHAAHLEQIGGL